MPSRVRTRTKGPHKGQKYPLRRVTTSESQVARLIRAGSPEHIAMTTIDKVDYVGSIPVEDGSGSRYLVTMQDGSKHDVEITDSLDTEAFDPLEDIGEGLGGQTAAEPRTITVVWDGAVDFSESYEATDQNSIDGARAALKKRYGALAREWLGER